MAEEAHRTDQARSDVPRREAWWRPVVRLLRWLLGAATLVGGLTWGLLNLEAPHVVLDMAVAGVLTAGGLVLLMPHRIQLPRRATTVAVVLAALAGTGAGGLVAEERVCCMYAHIENRGWPFDWAQRGVVAADPETAQRLAQSADWSVDVFSLGANLLLWAYAGMLLVVIAVLVRRNRGGPRRDNAVRP